MQNTVWRILIESQLAEIWRLVFLWSVTAPLANKAVVGMGRLIPFIMCTFKFVMLVLHGLFDRSKTKLKLLPDRFRNLLGKGQQAFFPDKSLSPSSLSMLHGCSCYIEMGNTGKTESYCSVGTLKILWKLLFTSG